MNDTDLTHVASHFAFGRNWAAYAEKITEAEIAAAVAGLQRLLGGGRLDGQRFLDIGSGSGLHTLAALRLGAGSALAVDIDPDSVETTRAVLHRHAPGTEWRAEVRSVFDLIPERDGLFDTVYSWGVLHHTGDMHRAIRCAAALVAPGGQFVFALYRRVWFDPFWRWEKRWYCRANGRTQARARRVYRALFRLGLAITGRSLADYVAHYHSSRGMHFDHDVHDWMGGWPYESISPREVEVRMQALGLEAVRSFVARGRLFGRKHGIFGSGCDEYVYRRPPVHVAGAPGSA